MKREHIFLLACLAILFALAVCDRGRGNDDYDDDKRRHPYLPFSCRLRRHCYNNPCSKEKCPRFPNATCKIDYCSCKAIFLDELNQVIPRFACASDSNYPQCLATRLCPAIGNQCRNGCPGVKDAKCLQNCDCRLIFIDRTGRLLNDRECNPVRQCPSLIPPNVRINYQVRCSKGNSIGSVCQISCNRGLVLFGGVSSVVCLKGGRWSRSLSRTRCDFDKRCSLFRPTVYANSNNITEIPLCSICPSTCQSGYICCPSPRCGSSCVPIRPPNPVQCPALNLNYGIYSCSRGTNIGSICTVTCKEGYTLIGGSRLTCNYNGQWSPKYFRPRCVPQRQCPALSAIDYNVKCTDGTNSKSVCQVVCPPGKRPERLSRVTCRYGKWFPNPALIRCVGDPRCPAVLPGQIGTCAFCPSQCPLGHICCPNGCGSSCIPLPTIKPVVDPRCPPVLPGQIGTCGFCPSQCPVGHICCPNGCGTSCTPLPTIKPVIRCPSPYRYRYPPLPVTYLKPHRPSFRLTCSNGFNLGSRCDVTCPTGTFLSGVAQITCLKTAQWNADLRNTRCTPRFVCPPGIPQVNCFASPCEFAKCPGEPNAVCVDNFCGGCNFDFFLNGRKLSRQECFPKIQCPLVYGRPRRPCRNVCSYARCPSIPRSICKIDCNCRPIFYHSVTYQQLTCPRVIYARINRGEDDDDNDDKIDPDHDDNTDDDDDDDMTGNQNTDDGYNNQDEEDEEQDNTQDNEQREEQDEDTDDSQDNQQNGEQNDDDH